MRVDYPDEPIQVVVDAVKLLGSDALSREEQNERRDSTTVLTFARLEGDPSARMS